MTVNVLRFDYLASDRNFSTTTDRVARKLDGLGAKVGRFGKFAGTALVGLGTAMTGLAAAGAVMGVKTAASLEQAQIGFTSLLGSGQKAQVFLRDLKRFAASTPFELPGLVDSSRLLIGVGVNTKDTMKILQTFGDAAGAVGVGQEQFQRIMLATSQAIGAGRFMTADLNQITANGIPIWTELSKATGKPIPKLRELASQGKLLSKDVLPLLEKQMGKDYGGSMAAQSKTLNGLWSTFMDTLNLGLADAIGPMIPMLKDGLAGATKVAADALKGLPGVLDTVVGKFMAVKGFVSKTLIPTLRTEFGKIGPSLPKIDISGLGAKFKDQAKDWAGLIILGVKVGLDTGDWSQLGRSLGNGLSRALKAGAAGAANLADAVGTWAKNVNWLAVGKSIGKTAGPFAIGFASTLVDGLIDAFMAHPVDMVKAIALIIPIGKVAVAFKPLRALIEHLPMGKWFISMLENTAGRIFDAAAGWVKNIGRGIAVGFRAEIPASAGWIRRLTIRMGDGLRLRVMYMIDRAKEFIGGITTGIGRMGGRVTLAIGRAIRWLTTPFTRSGSWLIGKGRDLIGGLVGGIRDRFGALGGTITSGIQRVRRPFTNAGSWLFQSGRQLVSGLRAGIWDGMKGIGGWVKGHLIDPIVGAVKRFFGIHSPSTVFAGIGRHLMSGLVGGMLRSNPGRIISKVFGGMPKALGSLVDKSLISIRSLPNKAMNALMGLGGQFSNLFGSLFGGGGGGGNAANRRLGQAMAARYGWGSGAQWQALNALMMGESGWNNNAQNPTSTAYGIGQFLNSTWATVGIRKTSDPRAQIEGMLRYVSKNYGSPLNAYRMWSSRAPHWYDAGGEARGAGMMPKRTLLPERILSPAQTRSFDRWMRGEHMARQQSQPVVIQVVADGSAASNALVQILRQSIRAKGGNVQAVLGKTG